MFLSENDGDVHEMYNFSQQEEEKELYSLPLVMKWTMSLPFSPLSIELVLSRKELQSALVFLTLTNMVNS